MVIQLIEGNPKFVKNLEKKERGQFLTIAECFYDTIQGEGIYSGYPAVFLRLQYCSLNCVFCDSKEVWRKGNPYSIDELLDLFEDKEVVKRLENGHHLVLTGGSPLLQQEALANFIRAFIQRFGFKPFIEIENECTLMPNELITKYVDCWNNSPKLENSEMTCSARYKPEVLKFLSSLSNCHFKFVISDINDWNEISTKFIETKLIKREQIILMPEGITRKQIRVNYEALVDLCCKENVRLSDRLHVTIWNLKTGV